MKKIYFDMAATTPINKRVLKAIKRSLKDIYGNPSSLHYEGRRASYEVEKARNTIAKHLGCKPNEIFFTSGASESNSWVAKCCRYRLIATNNSHASLDNFKFNKQLDVEQYTTPYGKLLRKNILISYPMINNETGIEELFYANYPFCHVDLTQALGKYNINLNKSKYIRFASASAHKIGGLKGCGILYIREDEQPFMKSLIDGHQQDNLRGGTENVVGIVSFGKAIDEIYNDFEKKQEKIKSLCEYIFCELSDIDEISTVHTNSNIVNITFKNINAQTAVQLFDKYGICVSAGSACNSEIDEPSESLLETGYSEEEALNTIRISINHTNTKYECVKFIQILKKIVDKFND